MALEYNHDDPKYEKYIKIAALDYNYPSAKFDFGKLIEKTDPDRSKTFIEAAFQSFHDAFKSNKEGLQKWQYWHLSKIASHLGRQSLVYEIDKIEENYQEK